MAESSQCNSYACTPTQPPFHRHSPPLPSSLSLVFALPSIVALPSIATIARCSVPSHSPDPAWLRLCCCAGMVVRPLVGVSGGVTRLLEGVSNTATIFDKAAAQKVREYPRAFYGPGRVMRPYSADDALVAALVRKLDGSEVSKRAAAPHSTAHPLLCGACCVRKEFVCPHSHTHMFSRHPKCPHAYRISGV